MGYVIAIGAMALLGGGMWLFVRLPPAVISRWLRLIAMGLAGLIALFLFIRGRPDLGFLFIGLIPLIKRFLPVPGFGNVGGGPAASTAPASTVETAWLRMTLDSGSGAVAGEILQGAFRGRRLADLTLADLLALRNECGHDPQSVNLIEAFLDRTHGTDWRGEAGSAESGGGAEAADDGRMTEARALAILGLERGADAEAIKAAHHRLMKKMHPDQGGSDFLAGEINAAKDFLLVKR